MRMLVKCPEHGTVLGDAEGYDVIVVTGDCGCRSRPYGSGTFEEGGCPEHGRSLIVFLDQTGASPASHKFMTLLACGCAGDLWMIGSLSLFRRQERQAVDD